MQSLRHCVRRIRTTVQQAQPCAALWHGLSGVEGRQPGLQQPPEPRNQSQERNQRRGNSSGPAAQARQAEPVPPGANIFHHLIREDTVEKTAAAESAASEAEDPSPQDAEEASKRPEPAFIRVQQESKVFHFATPKQLADYFGSDVSPSDITIEYSTAGQRQAFWVTFESQRDKISALSRFSPRARKKACMKVDSGVTAAGMARALSSPINRLLTDEQASGSYVLAVNIDEHAVLKDIHAFMYGFDTRPLPVAFLSRLAQGNLNTLKRAAVLKMKTPEEAARFVAEMNRFPLKNKLVRLQILH